MNRTLAWTALAWLSVGCAPVAAQPVPEGVLAPVTTYHRQEMQVVIDPEFPDAVKTDPPRAMFSRIDVNGDGVPDWRVDYEKAANASLFCGTGGCLQQVYVSRKGGYVLAFSRTAGTFALSRAKGERVLDLDFHGSVCGGAGVDECKRRYAWDEASGRFLERPNKKGQTWLEDGPARPVDLSADDAPSAAIAQVERRVATCKAVGGTFAADENPFNDLPDLNGDGVRDWVVGSYYDTCDGVDNGPALPVTILVSRGPDFVVGHEGGDARWGIDLAPSPHLVTFENDKPVPWRWNGEKLEPTP